jgi:hypothetical protein
MFDLGLFLTCQAISRQLAAMPIDFYLIRLIHSLTRRAAPVKQLWIAQDLARPRSCAVCANAMSWASTSMSGPMPKAATQATSFSTWIRPARRCSKTCAPTATNRARARRQTRSGTATAVPLTHEEIGEHIGVTRETVTRALGDFNDRPLGHSARCHVNDQ